SSMQGTYRKWCDNVGFKSMLKEDIKARQAAAAMPQPTLDSHLQPLPPKDVTVPYSDKSMRSSALKWFITTDQPISTLEEPTFVEMLNVAAR
ncbi:hypothetical protein CERSUDRAFT_37368, partial [Gelatoporia subvermispora B]